MRVGIATSTRFHIFDLAREMERLGHLQNLYTGYPRSQVDVAPRSKVRSFPWFVTGAALAARLHIATPGWFRPIEAASFDSWVARNLEPCDVFHALSSYAIESHRAARERYGALTVCDRGCSHMLFQQEIMREECARRGFSASLAHPRIIERELAEYETCDLITIPSRFSWRSFIAKGVPESKLRLNSYGVDIEAFRPVPKQDDVFRVLFVGHLSARKGLTYLLEAVKPLRLPKFELWLIGSKVAETPAILSGNEALFRYLGVMPRTELYKYYSQGSVLVLPSIEEGLAMVMAQAMACGVPVIGTTNTGAEDLFTDGVEGFIVPIRDPEAIRAKIVELYEHPEQREAMGRAALARVQSLGGWDSYGRKMAACYAMELERRGAQASSLAS